jgi:hypothetical protein
MAGIAATAAVVGTSSIVSGGGVGLVIVAVIAIAIIIIIRIRAQKVRTVRPKLRLEEVERFVLFCFVANVLLVAG